MSSFARSVFYIHQDTSLVNANIGEI